MTRRKPNTQTNLGCCLFHPHQRCGYSGSPLARIHYFYTAGPRKGLEAADTGARTHKKEVVPTSRNKYTFLLQKKYIEDVEQEKKDVPDLLGSIMRPTDPVKEELRRILMKISQFRSKFQEYKVCSFQMSAKILDFRQRLPAGAKQLLFSQFFPTSGKCKPYFLAFWFKSIHFHQNPP